MKGISGSSLYEVSNGAISAVVSDIKKSEFVPDKSVAIDYAGVIDSLYLHSALLPMRFGSIMESSEAIVEMLERNSDEIRKNLDKVAGRYEFGLKIFCDSAKLKATLAATIPEIAYHPDEGNKNSVYRDWVNRKLAEHRLEELLLAHVETVIKEITSYLDRLNSINKFKKMLTETTVVDAVFLIEKEKKGELIDSIKELQTHYPGLSFVLTGPWPSYSFVDVTIK